MLTDWDPISEHQAGLLCNGGFMKEHYDNRLAELIRTFTPEGIVVVKNILKEPEYQKAFFQILYNEIKYLPRETQEGIVAELKEMLQ